MCSWTSRLGVARHLWYLERIILVKCLIAYCSVNCKSHTETASTILKKNICNISEKHSLKMMYSFNLKGSEIHIFLVNKIEAFYKPGFLPHPHCSVLGDVRWQGIQYFSTVTGVRGMIFLQGFNFVKDFSFIWTNLLCLICLHEQLKRKKTLLPVVALSL